MVAARRLCGPPGAATLAGLLTTAGPALALQGATAGAGEAGSAHRLLDFTRPTKCLLGPRGDPKFNDILMYRWEAAANESGLLNDAALDDMSLFACNVPKYPWSYVENTTKMNHTKIHTYNFQGSFMWEYYRQVLPRWLWNIIAKGVPGQNASSPEQEASRNWIFDFIEENFTDNDILKVTDAIVWKPLGKFDVTQPGKWHDTRDAAIYAGGFRNEKYREYMLYYDPDYYQVMAQSYFTLCPGGDLNFSFRMFEAIMAGSIPVINSKTLDIGYPRMWALWQIPYKYYVLEDGDELVYRQDWVDENFRLFVKYQTFHEGDNIPPRRTEYGPATD